MSPTPTDGPQPLDRHGLLARVESDLELLRMLVGVFKADRSHRMEEIDAAVRTDDPAALSAAAHTMKGALSVFGAEPARLIAEEMETLGREGSTAGAKDLQARLHQAVVETESALDEFLKELS